MTGLPENSQVSAGIVFEDDRYLNVTFVVLLDALYDPDLANQCDVQDVAADSWTQTQTTTHRARHAWPPQLNHWPDWPQLWDALDIPDNARLPYADARREIASLINRIANA